MRLALAQYPVSWHDSWDGFESKLRDWVREAAENGARLLVFPEYGSMELTSLLREEDRADVRRQLPALQPYLERYVRLHAELAQQHGVFIVAGSFPVGEDDGRFVNRAFVLTPKGSVQQQDKLVMTRFENEQWGVSPGSGIKVFRTPLITFGVLICYDSEFPQPARAMAEAGADLIVVPSCTDSLRGYHRVRTGSRARALENQLYVAQTPLVGEAAWNAAIDVNVGQAGLFAPSDGDFPDDGVLAQGELNEPQWVYADLDVAALRSVRQGGHVLNYRDWPRAAEQTQGGALVVPITLPAPVTAEGDQAE